MTPPRRPLVRRDADGEARTDRSWASLTERLILEAQADGKFEDLPGRGRPLALPDDSLAGDMALGNHVLRNAGVAPPWIEADKEARHLAAAIEATLLQAGKAGPAARSRLRRRLAELADAHDLAVLRLSELAPTPRQHRRKVDRAALFARLEAASAA